MKLPGTVREGTPADAVDEVVPRLVASPGSAEDVARTLALASEARLRTVIRGGGSKIGWGRLAEAIDLVIDTTRLDALVAHRHGDMTATVQAGMSLASFNSRLAEHGQRLPVESAFDRATIGGTIATNDSGPLRHRFGTPRDLLIGVTLATTDGRLVKAGGTVVKNVAGYDLGRLVSGSCGTLAVIVDATFKLLPLPRASATLVVSYADTEALARDAAHVLGSQVEVVACDLQLGEGAPQLLIRVASSPRATEAAAGQVRALASGAVAAVTGRAEQALWNEQVRRPWLGGGTVVRLSWLPAQLPAVLDAVGRLERQGCRAVQLTGRVMGAGFLHVEGGDDACAAAVADLRASRHVGQVVVLQATRGLKQRIDVWGPPSAAAPMAVAVKQAFDPAGILNPGRGPV